MAGDPNARGLYFRPPAEIAKEIGLDETKLLRLEKAAYGLCDAPRAWWLRLNRELTAVGLKVSTLDPCLWRWYEHGKLAGVCGTYVDDLIGGGTERFSKLINKLRERLPFGEFRSWEVRFTGAEIRQSQATYQIELTQERYINDLQPVST